MNDLKREAEARDRLIDTFSKLLLQRVGVEGEDGGMSSVDGSTLAEEKLDVSQLEKSIGLLS